MQMLRDLYDLVFGQLRFKQTTFDGTIDPVEDGFQAPLGSLYKKLKSGRVVQTLQKVGPGPKDWEEIGSGGGGPGPGGDGSPTKNFVRFEDVNVDDNYIPQTNDAVVFDTNGFDRSVSFLATPGENSIFWVYPYEVDKTKQGPIKLEFDAPVFGSNDQELSLVDYGFVLIVEWDDKHGVFRVSEGGPLSSDNDAPTPVGCGDNISWACYEMDTGEVADIDEYYTFTKGAGFVAATTKQGNDTQGISSTPVENGQMQQGIPIEQPTVVGLSLDWSKLEALSSVQFSVGSQYPQGNQLTMMVSRYASVGTEQEDLSLILVATEDGMPVGNTVVQRPYLKSSVDVLFYFEESGAAIFLREAGTTQWVLGNKLEGHNAELLDILIYNQQEDLNPVVTEVFIAAGNILNFAGSANLPLGSWDICGDPVGVRVDKTALEDALHRYDDLVEDNYTEDSWAPLPDIAQDAQIVFDDPFAIQASVDSITQDLNDAINALVLKPSMSCPAAWGLMELPPYPVRPAEISGQTAKVTTEIVTEETLWAAQSYQDQPIMKGSLPKVFGLFVDGDYEGYNISSVSWATQSQDPEVIMSGGFNVTVWNNKQVIQLGDGQGNVLYQEEVPTGQLWFALMPDGNLRVWVDSTELELPDTSALTNEGVYVLFMVMGNSQIEGVKTLTIKSDATEIPENFFPFDAEDLCGTPIEGSTPIVGCTATYDPDQNSESNWVTPSKFEASPQIETDGSEKIEILSGHDSVVFKGYEDYVAANSGNPAKIISGVMVGAGPTRFAVDVKLERPDPETGVDYEIVFSGIDGITGTPANPEMIEPGFKLKVLVGDPESIWTGTGMHDTNILVDGTYVLQHRPIVWDADGKIEGTLIVVSAPSEKSHGTGYPVGSPKIYLYWEGELFTEVVFEGSGSL